MQSIFEDLQGIKSNLDERPRLAARPARLLMGLSMVLSDALALCLAWALAIFIRSKLIGPLGLDTTGWMGAIAGLNVLVFAVRRLYPMVGVGVIEEFRQLSIITSMIFITSGTIAYLLQNEGFSRLAFLLMWLFSLGMIPVFRGLVRHTLVRLGVWGEPVVVFGPPDLTRSVVEIFHQDPKLGIIPWLSIVSLDDLYQQCRSVDKKIDFTTAVIACEGVFDLANIRETYRDAFARVIMLDATNQLDLAGVNVRELGNRSTFEIRYTLEDTWAQNLKRALDLTGALFGLVLLILPLSLIALAIYLDSPGRIFYRQMRVGKSGRVFNLLKFRSMHLNADRVLLDYLATNPHMRKEWDCYQKLHDDPRITRVGRFLRRFSLDELPQLWNVLCGEMSLVGPRPIMINQQEIYGKNVKHYMRVVPGITGLWQISGRSRTSFQRRIEYDVQYVLNWSIWLDFYIFLRTIWVVLKRDGAC